MPDLPEAVYFHTSRHAAFAAAADLEPGIAYFAELGKNVGLTPQEVLKTYYNVPEELLLTEGTENLNAEEYIKLHLGIIGEQAQKSRTGYIKRMKKAGLKSGGRYAAVDFIGAGTTQMYLQLFANLKMEGFYFGSTNYEVDGTAEIKYFLGGENETLLNNYLEMEGFMTAPEPSLDYIDENGSCVFAADPRNAEDLQRVRTEHEAVMKYLNDYAAYFYFENDTVQPVIPEEMYAAGGCLDIMQSAYDDWGKSRIQR